jgi:hypothetical protein
MQGSAVRGPGFDAIAGMDAAAWLQFITDLQPTLDEAARRLLHRESAHAIIFEQNSDSLSRQIYDSMFAIDFVPRRATVYATCTEYGPAVPLMPYRNDRGEVVSSFDSMTCGESRDLLAQF